MSLRQAVILDLVRTPIGRARKGAFILTRIDELAVYLVDALLARNPGVRPEDVEDVLVGCAFPEAEQGINVARQITLLSKVPFTAASTTVNRFCGSSLQTTAFAAMAAVTGGGDLFLSLGIEHMTHVPMGGFNYGAGVNPRLYPDGRPSMPQTAQNVAERYGVTREEMDAFALGSQEKALGAQDAGRFADEIVPTPAKGWIEERKEDGKPRFIADGTEKMIDTDDCPRRGLSLEKLAGLKPLPNIAAGPGHEVDITAGNCCSINDGVAGAIVCSEAYARERGLKPKARIVSQAVAGVEDIYMGLGPIPATRKALARAGMTIDDIDLVELNEAFAAQAIPCRRELEIPDEKLNVNGGAIALGHPLGCTGVRLLTTLVHELARRPDARTGLATQCIGGGQGIAMIVEKT